MLGMRLGPWVLALASAPMASACAGGGEGPATSVFDPSGGNETGPATSSDDGPDPAGGMTSPPPSSDVTGEPPDASCCQVAPTPGCGSQETEMCVCTIRPECCQSVWNQDCVDLAIDPCADPLCGAPETTGEPGDGTDGSSSGGGPPTQSCEELAAQEGWTYYRCQQPTDVQCNDMGTPTTDCDHCCGYCNAPDDVSCGDLATMNGWGAANCEWNGNGACGGSGTPTCDCNFCCEVN